VLAVECFVDELAVAAHQDPYVFEELYSLQLKTESLSLMTEGLRQISRCSRFSCAESDWGRPMQRHRGRGNQLCSIYDGYHAQVAEVTVKMGTSRSTVSFAVVDCGQVVNPRKWCAVAGLKADCLWARAVLKVKITIANGQVQQKKFNSY